MLACLALHAHLVNVVDGRVPAGLVEPKPPVARPNHGGRLRLGHICVSRAADPPPRRGCAGAQPRTAPQAAARAGPLGGADMAMHPPMPALRVQAQPGLTLGDSVRAARSAMSAITMHESDLDTLNSMSLSRNTARPAAIVVSDTTDGASSALPEMYPLFSRSARSPARRLPPPRAPRLRAPTSAPPRRPLPTR